MQIPAMLPRSESSPDWWRGEKNVVTFHVSWLRLYATLAAWHILILAPILALASWQVGVNLAGMLLLALLADLVLSLLGGFWTTHVSEKGIQSYNFWGLRSRFLWEEIEEAVPSRLFGIPWLKVRARGQRSRMWLPLFYPNRRAFYESVAHYAPDCPILPRDG